MNTDSLIALYNQTSKHSHYQILATPLRPLIPASSLETHSRFEQERLDFMLQNLPYKNATLADIGGNTGFFTFELLDRGVKAVLFFEGNQAHSEFVEEAAQVLGWQNRIIVYHAYFDFNHNLSLINTDICLLLNVLHHVGDDYGNTIRSVTKAKQNIIDSLNRLAFHTHYLVFQLGFNWMGDRNRPLFAHGTKREVIDFITQGTSDFWQIDKIGIAERSQTGIVYREVSDKNIARDDSLGEFLNRPLFILRSRQMTQ